MKYSCSTHFDECLPQGNHGKFFFMLSMMPSLLLSQPTIIISNIYPVLLSPTEIVHSVTHHFYSPVLKCIVVAQPVLALKGCKHDPVLHQAVWEGEEEGMEGSMEAGRGHTWAGRGWTMDRFEFSKGWDQQQQTSYPNPHSCCPLIYLLK